MSITIAPVCKSTRRAHARAILNVCGLLTELAAPHVVLLDWLSVQVELQRGDAKLHRLLHPHKIVSDMELLEAFKFRRRGRPSKLQVRAVATFKRQVVEMLDAHTRFTSRRAWKVAARNDLHIKPTNFGVIEAIQVLSGKMRRLRDGSPNFERQLLSDIVLMRDNLRAQRIAQDAIDSHMETAFPRTYRFLAEFEALIENLAARIATKRHPELAAQVSSAMQAAIQELQIICPSDLSPLQLKDFEGG